MKKKLAILSLVLIVVMLFSACEATSDQKALAEQMLMKLSECDLAGATEYLSPRIAANSRTGLLQIASALNRRTAELIKETNVYFGIKLDNGYIGIEKRINYLVVLSDGTAGELQTIHYSGQGFVGFYLNLEDISTNQNDDNSTI